MTGDGTTAVAARRSPRSWTWLGIVPFFVFTIFFLILPTLELLVGAFRTPDGSFTLDNIARLDQPSIINAFRVSIELSLASALLGALVGFFIAWAVAMGRVPAVLRPFVTTFAGVASNFAGIPLAFAFLATLGPMGLVTLFLSQELGINLRALGFSILSFWGLTITYLYFQIPLMVLILLPALDSLRKEWREAAAILGATPAQYWRHVALPVLWPSLLGTTILLFANAFGAVATAFALTGSTLNIVPILLFAQIRGDVLHDPHLGYALALGMVVITG
ncbi:MAG: ABC transporter permease subunit, partial [Rhizobiales bacterium]|nr:ABC transporter permease subunit [Hyphomicrobiales bacterium]